MTLKHVYHFSASLDLVCLKTSFSVRTIVLLSHTFIAGFYSHWLFIFFLTRSNINWPFYITTLLWYLHKLYRVLGEGLCIFLQGSRPSYPNELTVCFFIVMLGHLHPLSIFPSFSKKKWLHFRQLQADKQEIYSKT